MVRTPRPLRFVVALLAVAALAAGCGDDDDATSDSASVPASTASTASSTTSTTTSTTTATTDDGAAPPPDGVGGPDEGQGDPLVFVTDLAAAAEVPGPGDSGGAGRAEIESAVDGRLCVDMVATGLDAAVVAAHVHEAPAGANGGVVIDIGVPTLVDADTDSWTDVCLEVDSAVVERMNADPSQFYVNVHTETFGDGAVRGQLEQATIFDLELS